jgi:glutamate mutase epsilon subunit
VTLEVRLTDTDVRRVFLDGFAAGALNQNTPPTGAKEGELLALWRAARVFGQQVRRVTAGQIQLPDELDKWSS